jgi:hypothetical protein
MESGFGCYVNQQYVGACGYADDVILLSPTIFGTQEMLKICEDYAKEYNVRFNASKSKLIVQKKCGPRESTDPPHLLFMGGSIEYVKYDKHLGNFVGEGASDVGLSAVIGDFNRRVNMLKFSFKNLPLNILYFLFKTYCMPLYGSQLFDISSSKMDKFFVAWRKAIRFLFGLPYRTHSKLLHLIVKDMPIDAQIIKRFMSFHCSLANSSNSIVRSCYELVLAGSQSSVSNSLSHVSEFFNISRDNVNDFVSNGLFVSNDSDEDIAIAGVITELLDFISLQYLNVMPSVLSREDCLTMIELLCTS